MDRLGSKRIMVAACVLVAGLTAAGWGRVIHVDDNAAGADDGSSWSDAYTYLQDALAVAESGDEIRVARGVYTPDRGVGIVPGDRDASFHLISGVTLTGGYAGSAGDDPDERDVERYETILTGDLNGDDGPDFANIGDNSVIVVRAVGNDTATTLDGFTISGGWGGGRQGGAGIMCIDSHLLISACTIARNKTRGAGTNGAGVSNVGGGPVLSGCVFTENLAWGDGGGFWSASGHPVFVDCLFEANVAERFGGGLCIAAGGVTLDRCTFRRNDAFSGAGLSARPETDSECIECVFVDNAAWHPLHENLSSGGGAAIGRGTYFAPVGAMTFRGCRFEDNTAGNGAGLACGSGRVRTIDCVFHRNEARQSGGGIANHGPTQRTGTDVDPEQNLVMTRCTFTENTAARGGALDNTHSAPTLIDCTFGDNVGGGTGGAVYTLSGLSRGGGAPVEVAPTLIGCRFIANRAADARGGGLFNDNSNTTLVNCLFAGNVAGDGGGLYNQGAGPTLRHCTLAQNSGGGLSDAAGQTLLDHCIVWGNADNEILGPVLAVYSNIGGGWPGEGNLDVNPLFADLGYWDPDEPVSRRPRVRGLSETVWIDGDYHLKSQAGRWDPIAESWVQDDVTSPCIDAGDPTAPVGDEPIPNGGIVNLGAYGGTAEASKSWFGGPTLDLPSTVAR